MTDPVSAGLLTHTGAALPEWIDYNGHLMDGYYCIAFTYATEGFLEYVGFGPKYRERTGSSIYTVEGHINYLREVKAGAPLRFTTQLLDYDSKRLHAFHYMVDESEGCLSATNELMFLHVNPGAGKAEPMPPGHLPGLAALLQAHRDLPRPPQAGRSIGIPKRAAP